jgi:enoyl-CoA hydratase/carnithine racemase
VSAAEAFRLEAEGGIGLLRIDRVERRNALDEPMMDELGRLCRVVERREDIGVLILTGTGRSFCAGGDIDAWSGRPAAAFARHWVRDGHEALDRLARLRQPVIAVLNGHALGGGLELAACADYRIAEAQVKLGQPETGLGVVCGWSGTQRAVRRFGAGPVRRMALFGEVLEAEAARALGLVDAVAPEGEGLAAGKALAARLLTKGPVATELTKMMINAAEGEERERVMDALASRIAAAQPELAEGLAAFREKRAPDFSALRKGTSEGDDA